MRLSNRIAVLASLCVVGSFVACSSSGRADFANGGGNEEEAGVGGSSGLPSDDGGFGGGIDGGGGGPGLTVDPTTCAEAEAAASYVGCDYWPTITSNVVNSQFDFAVVVSNTGDNAAKVHVTGPNGVDQQVDVAPGALATIPLPWVQSLKGADQVSGVSYGGVEQSVMERGGAYHLVSDVPVIVYQFNPLQYKKGTTRSYSNDASLLLPSTAMTGNYRLMGSYGLTSGTTNAAGGYFVVTGTKDNTTVEVALGSKAKILGAGDITSAAAGSTLTFTLNAGDVAEVITDKGETFDASGSLLKASQPVQVITGQPCMQFPKNVTACDHIEETVFPAETLGKRYVVSRPFGAAGKVVPHFVRLYGNVDNTSLTYRPSKPEGCPDTLSAGEVVNCGSTTAADFEVEGDNAFGVGVFLLGAQLVDPPPSVWAINHIGRGDPSQSFVVAVEQYRSRYVFLAPTDYDINYVNVVAPVGASITLDGNDETGQLQALEGTEYLHARIKLSAGNNGAHTLESSAPVGIQVVGYGEYTSYQYPGGLNLGKIAPPPVR